MFPGEAEIAEEPSHAESYNVLPTDFGASQFVVKSLLLCENQKIFLKYFDKTSQLSYFCRLERFTFSHSSVTTLVVPGLMLK